MIHTSPDIEELKRLFLLLEKLVGFFHDPDKYPGCESVSKFLGRIPDQGVYYELHTMFYDVIPKWLPPDVYEEFLNRF